MTTATPQDPIPTEPTTIEDWTAIQPLFPRFGGRAFFKWLGGVSPRLRRDRLSRLLVHPAAGSIAALLDQRSAHRVKALRTYAAVNMEQASAALRMTIIVNVSIPVIIITILSQISSGQIWEIYWSLYEGDPIQGVGLVTPILIAVAMLMWIIGLGATRLGQARDMRHLIDLFAADRGIYFGLDDTDDLSPQ